MLNWDTFEFNRSRNHSASLLFVPDAAKKFIWWTSLGCPTAKFLWMVVVCEERIRTRMEGGGWAIPSKMMPGFGTQFGWVLVGQTLGFYTASSPRQETATTTPLGEPGSQKNILELRNFWSFSSVALFSCQVWYYYIF